MYRSKQRRSYKRSGSKNVNRRRKKNNRQLLSYVIVHEVTQRIKVGTTNNMAALMRKHPDYMLIGLLPGDQTNELHYRWTMEHRRTVMNGVDLLEGFGNFTYMLTSPIEIRSTRNPTSLVNRFGKRLVGITLAQGEAELKHGVVKRWIEHGVVTAHDLAVVNQQQ